MSLTALPFLLSDKKNPMGSTTIDPTVTLNPSDSLRTYLSSLVFEGEVPPSIAKLIEGEDTSLTTSDLKWLKNSEKCSNLGDLLFKSSLSLPSPVYPDRDPGLEERTQRLRMEQNEREYRRMTANVKGSAGKPKYQAGNIFSS